MKRRALCFIMIAIMSCLLIAGCGGSSSKAEVSPDKKTETFGEAGEAEETGDADDTQESPVKPAKKKKNISDVRSLAERMAGIYSCHYSAGNDDEELYIMDVVNFGDNLYAFCESAMPDGETFEPFNFWACEFIPYDEREMASADGDSVRVNALNFSIMSNAGKYWDSGHTGTITLTDEGLAFDGFDNDGFLVPYDDDSRLFIKDKRAGDAFTYLKHDKASGDEELQGYWVSSGRDGDLYIRFSGSDMYMYMKNPDREVVLAAGGCDFGDGHFDCTASYIQAGGMPVEFSSDYEVDGDRLTLDTEGFDAPDQLAGRRDFDRIRDKNIHVTTMDEIVFNEDSFGAFGQMEKEPFYGVWLNAFKDEEDAKALVAKLRDKDLPAFYVYSCDWENLNKDPYYCVTIGRSDTEDGAGAYMKDAEEAGYGSAYVKYTGDYISR